MTNPSGTNDMDPPGGLRSGRMLVMGVIALVGLLMSANALIVRYSEGSVYDAASFQRATLLACEPWIPWLLLAFPLAWLFTAVSVTSGPLWRFLLIHGVAAGAVGCGLILGWGQITEPMLHSVRHDAVMDREDPSAGAVFSFVEDDRGAGSCGSGECTCSFQPTVHIPGATDPVSSPHIRPIRTLPFLPALFTHLLAYFTLLALSQGLLFFRELTRGREEAALMQARYDRMRLDSLLSHIDPHFLYNALTAISSSSREDGETVRRMITDLSSLLRASSARDGSLRSTLDEELKLASAYVSLIQRRFRDRLVVEFDIADEARGVLMPSWTLQPLLENVVVHGVHATRAPVTAKVRAFLRGDELHMVVRDDAPASKEPTAGLGGTALRNLRERLGALFGPAASLSSSPGAEGGFCTTIRIPQADGK